MPWGYRLGNTPSFSFTRDNGTVERFGNGEGESKLFETESTCELVRFLQSHVANPREIRQGWFKDVEKAAAEEGCPANLSADGVVAPQQAPPPPPPADTDPSLHGDSASQQSAPTPSSSGEVGGAKSDAAPKPNPPPGEEPTRPHEGERHPTHGDEQSQQRTEAGDPVDVFAGALYLQETDLEVPNSVLPLTFTRFYRSGAAAFGPLGWNWDHNLNLHVRELANGDLALWRNLHEDVFVLDGTAFRPPPGTFETLERVPALPQVFQLTGRGGTTIRFERPAGWQDGERIPVSLVRDRHGNQLTFIYGANDRLTRTFDDDGRFLQLSYDQCGLVTAVEDHAGRRYNYEHDEETQQLHCVTSPATSDHPRGITRIYYYEQPYAFPELRHNILRIEDGEGRTYLENTYEQDPASWSYGRITEQLHGGFLYQFRYTQLQWVPANPLFINTPAVQVEVLNPDLGLETHTFNYRGDLLDHRRRLCKDGSFRVVVSQYEYDEEGNVTAVTAPDGSQELTTFDVENSDPRMRANVLQREITAAAGFPGASRIIWRGRYEPRFQLLIEEENEKHAVTRYVYDFDETPAAPDNTGKLKKTIYPDSTLPDGTVQHCVLEHEHNARGQITANLYPDGTREEMTYGASGTERSRLTETRTDPDGLDIRHRVHYDAFGYIRMQVDGNGSETTTIHNALGQLEQRVAPAVNGQTATTRFRYDSDNHLIATERPKGTFEGLTDSHIIDQLERDVLGYIVKLRLSSNTSEPRELRLCNDFRGTPVQVANPDGSLVKRHVDERGLLLREALRGSDGTEVVVRNVYDRSGRLIRTVQPSGATTTYTYDGFGRVATIDLPSGSRIANTWGANDLLAMEELFGDDGQGARRLLRSAAYEYDEKDRRMKVTSRSFVSDPTASISLQTQYFFDPMDRLVRSVDFKGAVSQAFYDRAGRLTRVVDPEGNEERYTLDRNGRVTRTAAHHREPSGGTSVISKEYAYDERGRITTTVEPDGATSVTEWDDRDLVVGRTNLLGISTVSQYNSFGRKIKDVFDPQGLRITHEWTVDSMGRLSTYRDPAGQTSQYSYDSVGRAAHLAYPNGYSSRRTYGASGLLEREVLGSGVVFNYLYDAADRLITVENPFSPPGVSAVLPQRFSFDGMDRIVSAEVGANRIERRYDSLSRLVAETANGETIGCIYDDIASTVDKSYPDGRRERFAHDLNGSPSTVAEVSSGALGAGIGSLATLSPSGPDHFGRAQYRNGFQLQAAYDERKRLVELMMTNGGSTNESVKYRYDAGNRRRVEGMIGKNTEVNHYEFDGKNRLLTSKHRIATSVPDAHTQADHDAAIEVVSGNAATAQWEEAFTYSASDERLTYVRDGNPEKTYTYLPGHRIQGDGTAVHSYNQDGTIRSDSTLEYEADAMGRVTRILQGGAVALEIEYDALGRPSVLQELGRPRRAFLYLGDSIEQENRSGAAFRQFTLHPVSGIPIAFHGAGASHYSLFDDRFNLIGLTDTSGNIVEAYRYTSFGLPRIFDAGGNNVPNSALDVEPMFGGQRFLNSVGLYLSTRRLMNPANGVFLSPDPKSYIDSPSLYVYAGQNPIDFVDPTGEEKNGGSGGSGLDTGRSVLTGLNPITEGGIWDPAMWGRLTPAEKLAINARRGVILEWLAGNNLGRYFAKADKVTPTAVIQMKSIFSSSAKYIEGVVRRATRDAATAIARNTARFGGRAPQAQIFFRSGTSSRLIDAARNALLRGKVPRGALNPSIIVGLPGKIGVALKWVGRAGGVLSVLSLANDIRNGDVMGIVGSGTGTLSFALAELGLLPAAAVAGSFSIGWEAGRWIDKKTGWGTSLTERAVRNRETYRDLGLGDTSSTLLGGAACIPILSEAGQGIGWGAFKLYQGGSYVVDEVDEFIESRDWGKTIRPWRWFD